MSFLSFSGVVPEEVNSQDLRPDGTHKQKPQSRRQREGDGRQEARRTFESHDSGRSQEQYSSYRPPQEDLVNHDPGYASDQVATVATRLGQRARQETERPRESDDEPRGEDRIRKWGESVIPETDVGKEGEKGHQNIGSDDQDKGIGERSRQHQPATRPGRGQSEHTSNNRSRSERKNKSNHASGPEEKGSGDLVDDAMRLLFYLRDMIDRAPQPDYEPTSPSAVITEIQLVDCRDKLVILADKSGICVERLKELGFNFARDDGQAKKEARHPDDIILKKTLVQLGGIWREIVEGCGIPEDRLIALGLVQRRALKIG